MQKIEEIKEIIRKDRETAEFFPTGFTQVDSHLDGGFMKKELIIIGASTGTGKSMYAGQIFYMIAKKGVSSAYFSLEISNSMIYSRLVGSLANLKANRLTTGFLTADEYQRKIDGESRVDCYSEFMTFYDDLYELDKIKAEIRTHKYEFVVIDFIQNIFAKGQSEYDRMSFISLDLQKFAKEQNCCILLLSQLSNTVAREGNKFTGIEFKGSGNIATVCDLAFFITRPDIEDVTTTTLLLRKNRRGIAGLAWRMKFQQPGGFLTEEMQTYV